MAQHGGRTQHRGRGQAGAEGGQQRASAVGMMAGATPFVPPLHSIPHPTHRPLCTPAPCSAHACGTQGVRSPQQALQETSSTLGNTRKGMLDGAGAGVGGGGGRRACVRQYSPPCPTHGRPTFVPVHGAPFVPVHPPPPRSHPPLPHPAPLACDTQGVRQISKRTL